MDSKTIRRKYIEFFTSSPRNHKEIPNVSLVPSDPSPTLLFVNSGMYPLVPYLSGEEKHPLGKRLCNVQRCIRDVDIEEVGDNRHHTLFEQVGNWSLGDYFKKEQLNWWMEFLVDVLKLDPNRLYMTVFTGGEGLPRDDEAIEVWKQVYRKYGIKAEYSEVPYIAFKEERNKKIFGYDKSENWWDRGEAVGELGGPDSETFYDLGEDLKIHENSPFKDKPCHVNCDCGRFVELGNSVFMQYRRTEDGYEELSQKNIDFGGGLERIVFITQGRRDQYETDLFMPIIKGTEKFAGKSFGDSEEADLSFKIIADHIRGAVFAIADGASPSNKEQGYIVRRLIRRAIRRGKMLGVDQNFLTGLAEVVIREYAEPYPHLEENKDAVFEQIDKEENNFRRTLNRGLKELERIKEKGIDGKRAFYIYETYGFPLEMTLEELTVGGEQEKRVKEGFEKAKKEHQEQSRKGAEKKFKGGLADHSEETTRLHTVAHLMLAALRKVLGDHVHQKGSNINPERLRFDFSHGEKLTNEQKAEVEKLVNEWVDRELKVDVEEMSVDEAKKRGAEGVFDERYGDKVKVYKIWDPDKEEVVSFEICGGPHVKNTKDIKKVGKFRITKEESSGAGVRRIKADLSR